MPDIVYSAAVFRFSAEPPFAPTGAPVGLLELPNPFGTKRVHENLNPAVERVEYPCGAILEDDHWFVSFGLNDEHAAIAVLTRKQVETTLESLSEGISTA